MRRISLGRRAVLRGGAGAALATVGLPRLGAMLNGNGDAYADGTPLPRRYGTWFWGNGILIPRWVPKGTGRDWTLSEQLAPLAKVKDDISVVTGMEMKTSGNVHGAGTVGVLTGAACRGGSEPEMIPVLPSIDQVIAQAMTEKTRFRSLEMGCCRNSGESARYGGGLFNISYTGPNAYNRLDYSPTNVYNRLLGGGRMVADPRIGPRRSVLDVIRQDAVEVRGRLGREDQARLDQHMEGIRLLEQRLSLLPQPQAGSCKAPTMPTSGDTAINKIRRVAVQAMTDLAAYALACDQTRVFSFLLCGPGHFCTFDDPPFDTFHKVCHDEPEPQPTVNKFVIRSMELLALFLEKLKSIPEGAGTLLDNCAIMATSDVSYGKTHSHKDYPLIVAGRAGGKLRSGIHYRSASGEMTTKVPLTLARAVGIPLKEMGKGGGYTADSLAALEV